MTLVVNTKVDDTNKAIITASGVGEDSGTLFSSDKSISLANVYYEIRGNDYENEIYPKVTLTLGDQTLVLERFGNWGLKEGEKRKEGALGKAPVHRRQSDRQESAGGAHGRRRLDQGGKAARRPAGQVLDRPEGRQEVPLHYRSS